METQDRGAGKLKIAGLASRVLLLAASAVLVLSNSAAAQYSDGWGSFQGSTYFENVYVGGGSNYNWIPEGAHGSFSVNGSVMPDWHGGTTASGGGAVGTKALGVAQTESDSQVLKQALYEYLYKSNTNQLHASGTPAGQWDRMGSAVVVHTMLGSKFNDPGRNTSRTVSTADWAALKARLVDNNSIVMSRQNYNARENTAGIMVGPGFNTFDAARYTYDPGMIGNRDSWVLRDGSGNIVYVIEIVCANPLGNFSGLPSYIPPPPPPPQQYDLAPKAEVNKTTSVEAGEVVDVTNTVTNSGPDASAETIWRLTELVYGPGTNMTGVLNEALEGPNEPCQKFNVGGRTSCETRQEITDATFAPGAPRAFDPVYAYNVPDDAEVGTRICFTASVSRPTEEASPVWRHSALSCVTVGKKPKVQIWGGDVRVGGVINTSKSTFGSLGRTFGSWGEYAALSRGVNSELGTGAGLNNGSVDSSQSMWSRLTFANTGMGAACPDAFGCYNFSLISSSLAGQFPSSTAPMISGSQNLNDLASGTYRTNGGNLQLSGTTIDQGKTIIIKSEGTVTIEGDITYHNGPYSDLRSIPQVVIQAPTINIRENVGRIDAWLFAATSAQSGVMNTCYSNDAVDAPLTAAMCNTPLTVNGPVAVDRLYLRRTAGSGNQADERGSPAEIFNLRADAYLWGNSYGSGANRAQTVHIRELPPRF